MRRARAICGCCRRCSLKLTLPAYGVIVASTILYGRSSAALPLLCSAQCVCFAHTVGGLGLAHCLPLVRSAHGKRCADTVGMIASSARLPFACEITRRVCSTLAIMVSTSRFRFPLGGTATRVFCACTVRVRACCGCYPFISNTHCMRLTRAITV